MFAPFLTVSSSLGVEVSRSVVVNESAKEIQHTYRFICLQLLCVITIERLENVFNFLSSREFNFNPFGFINSCLEYTFVHVPV